jgi:hypothetical protein
MKGRKTNKQSHVDVDVTITNKNQSTKASTKEASSTKGNINKPEPAKDSPRLFHHLAYHLFLHDVVLVHYFLH